MPHARHCGAGHPHVMSSAILSNFVDVETGPDSPDEDTEAGTGHTTCPRSPGSEWLKQDLTLRLGRLPGLPPRSHSLQSPSRALCLLPRPSRWPPAHARPSPSPQCRQTGFDPLYAAGPHVGRQAPGRPRLCPRIQSPAPLRGTWPTPRGGRHGPFCTLGLSNVLFTLSSARTRKKSFESLGSKRLRDTNTQPDLYLMIPRYNGRLKNPSCLRYL